MFGPWCCHQHARRWTLGCLSHAAPWIIELYVVSHKPDVARSMNWWNIAVLYATWVQTKNRIEEFWSCHWVKRFTMKEVKQKFFIYFRLWIPENTFDSIALLSQQPSGRGCVLVVLAQSCTLRPHQRWLKLRLLPGASCVTELYSSAKSSRWNWLNNKRSRTVLLGVYTCPSRCWPCILISLQPQWCRN